MKTGVLVDDENIEDFEKYENLVEEGFEQEHEFKKINNSKPDLSQNYDARFDAEDEIVHEEEKEEYDEEEDDDKNLMRLDIKAEDYDYSTNKFYQNYLAERDVEDSDYTEQIGQNGKINRTYTNGKQMVIFSNGARREVRT